MNKLYENIKVNIVYLCSTYLIKVLYLRVNICNNYKLEYCFSL